MSDDNIFGEALEQLGDTAKQGAKQLASVPGAVVKTAVGQISGTDQSQEGSEQFVKDLYGAGQKKPQASQNQTSQQLAKPLDAKAAEDEAKLAALRKQFHKDYAEQLDTPREPEERVADRLERERKEEEEKKLAEIEEQKKHDLSGLAPKLPGDPLSVTRAKTTTEINRGTSG